ncbi:alpha-L-fucosidase [Daejeonella lutea]|nr:alpha-L-fucosidase [Daejeonella lutea]
MTGSSKKSSTCLLLILLCLMLNAGLAKAQQYQPNWQSLDKRTVPEWYTQSKFGIFIHWGVYSVPGWSTKGNYAEWYQQGLQTTDKARQEFHKKKFGDRTYYDLASDFKAELYNPDDWANLIESSGAKYVVLTSKHHDGYALWPSKEADRTWGFPWNSVSSGPKRDLLGDLFTALRKTSVRPGMYYSLYEWFNPLWKTDKDKYIDTHMWPQMKELVNTYKPEVFWTDGEWDLPAERWKSEQFLAWLYNDSPVKNSVVTIDRWGSGVRFNHGAVYSPEYQPDLDFEDHPWEESRGIGYSYGYNREEDAWDYTSTQSLVISLVDKVSRGGNFLLDIGPDEHGKIPPIMQERLLQIGDWMKVNNEAIYNTVRWKTPSQWSEGNRNYVAKKVEGDWKTTNDYMMKITVDPDLGYAVKEVFYTYNPTSNTLYAILPKYPSSKKITLKDVQLGQQVKARLLNSGSDLTFRVDGSGTEISLPEYDPNTVKAPYAFVIRLTDFGAFAKRPSISVLQNNKSLKAEVNITAEPGSEIFYTLDGSEPSTSSTRYSKPFALNAQGTIKAIAAKAGMLDSKVSNADAKLYTWNSALRATVKPGIAYEYIEPEGKITMESADQGAAKITGTAGEFSLTQKQRAEKFAFRFAGYLSIESDGIYTFFLDSDDGSKLMINDKLIALNDGPEKKPEGSIALKKGLHKINLSYYDSGGGNHLKVSIQKYGGEKIPLPAALLFR